MESTTTILNKIRQAKGQDANETIKEKSKGTLTGALIGGGVGLLYAFKSKKNYLVFGVVGVLIGGLVSNIFLSKEVNKPTIDQPQETED